MFYDTAASVLDGNFVKTGQLLCDLQPTSSPFIFADGIELEITCRAFCPAGVFLSLKDYLLVGDALYKIMQIKRWDDHQTLLLYRCERSRP